MGDMHLCYELWHYPVKIFFREVKKPEKKEDKSDETGEPAAKKSKTEEAEMITVKKVNIISHCKWSCTP